MISTPRTIVGLLFCAFSLCFLLSSNTNAINNSAEELQEQKSIQKADGHAGPREKENAATGLRTIHAEVLHVEDDAYVVRKYEISYACGSTTRLT